MRVVHPVVCLPVTNRLVMSRVFLGLLVALRLKWHPLPMITAGMLETRQVRVPPPVLLIPFPMVNEPKASRNPLPLMFLLVKNLVTLLGAVSPPLSRTVLNMVPRIPRLIFTVLRATNSRLRMP